MWVQVIDVTGLALLAAILYLDWRILETDRRILELHLRDDQRD